MFDGFAFRPSFHNFVVDLPRPPRSSGKHFRRVCAASWEILGAGGFDGRTDSVYVAIAVETDPFSKIWGDVRSSPVMEEESKETAAPELQAP